MHTLGLKSLAVSATLVALVALAGPRTAIADQNGPDTGGAQPNASATLLEGEVPSVEVGMEQALAPEDYGTGAAQTRGEAAKTQDEVVTAEAAARLVAEQGASGVVDAQAVAGPATDSAGLAARDRALDAAQSALPQTQDLAKVQVARTKIQSDVAVLGVTLPGGATPEGATITYRLLHGDTWDQWKEWDLENEAEGARGKQGTDPLLALDASAVEAVIRDSEGTPLPDARLVVIGQDEEPTGQTPASEATSSQTPVPPAPDGASTTEPTATDAPAPASPAEIDSTTHRAPATAEEDTAALLSGTTAGARLRGAANPDQLSTYSPGYHGLQIVTRKGLGISSTSDWDLEKITPKGVVIHHTAGNNNYSRAQAPQAVRGVHQYHASTLGWGDVGYHFLVDRYGTVYQGREGSLTGFYEAGHARGANSNTLGVSVVGDFTNVEPPIAAQNAVAKVSAWLLKRMGAHNVDAPIRVTGQPAVGRTIKTLSGHRDVGGTACPGQAFYDKLPRLRTVVQNLLNGRDSWIDANGQIRTGAAGAGTGPTKPMVSGGRLSGNTRFDTAVAISRHAFPDHSASAVYLVNANSPVDAMTAGVVTDGPVLPVHATSVPAVVKAEVERLGASQIVLVGGTGVLSDSLFQAFPGKARVRLGGADRFETARLIARRAFPGGARSVYVADAFGADGQGSPDAVVAANAEDGPVLLSRVGGPLDPGTRADITRMSSSVKILGGADLGVAGTRLAGPDRYATALASAKAAYTGKVSTVYLVRGDVLADGVAAGVITTGPRVLSHSEVLPPSVCTYLKQTRPTKVVAIGGTGAIHDSTLDEARACAAG
ncbi:cell wall-binding repeat-containing protein [Schaalia sp. 19OD2882]|uniref:cell wall-binding repeat-containing protein n=1 Tax=Schaalia sp. 19OD2882 TaxID=2794089 RepID=UPI001C1F0274|nr:cell wall-binding repeat-containing protein [Schaalia sp. 19OD2882]QWW20264.1 cell wall-binding repeat-containing protein [Schaalia sp. 19OD2882]